MESLRLRRTVGPARLRWALSLALSLFTLADARAADVDQGGQGSAGPGSAQMRTLLLFTAPRVAYGLGDELEFLLLQLRSVAHQVEAIPVNDARPDRFEGADHVVLFCPRQEPVLPQLLLSNLVSGVRPVLWVGHLPEALSRHPLFDGKFAPPHPADSLLHQVTYRGRDWPVGDATWIPMELTPDSGAAVALTVTRPDHAGLLSPAWRQGAMTFYSAIPEPGLLAFLFADVLPDFYGLADAQPSRLLLRIDDYQAGSDHAEFQRKVDFLATRGRPFLVSVTPSWREAPTGAVMTLDAAPEFVNGLRYAQARGGRLLLCGSVRDGTDRPEFWDSDLDRPVGMAPAEVRRRLEAAAGLMLKHGLLPLAWHTPRDAASRAVYQEVARLFSTSVERPQLSDLTQRESALLSRPTVDGAGRRILPENLGFIPLAATNTSTIAAMRERAAFITRLRGTVAGAYVHSYLNSGELAGLIGELEALHKPFLDLAELDNWVHLPGRVLLTGRAERSVRLAGGVLTWKAYNRGGKLLRTEQEFALPGERLLKRKGQGDCELYEFGEVNP